MVKVSKLEKLVEFVCQSCHMERSSPSRSKIILRTSCDSLQVVSIWIWPHPYSIYSSEFSKSLHDLVQIGKWTLLDFYWVLNASVELCVRIHEGVFIDLLSFCHSSELLKDNFGTVSNSIREFRDSSPDWFVDLGKNKRQIFFLFRRGKGTRSPSVHCSMLDNSL